MAKQLLFCSHLSASRDSDNRHIGLRHSFASDDFGRRCVHTIWIRWFLILLWLVMANYRPEDMRTLYILDVMGTFMLVTNAILHRSVRFGEAVDRPFLRIVNVSDLAIITGAVVLTHRFDSDFFVAYFPVLLNASFLIDSLRWIVLLSLSTVAAYAIVSIVLGDGILIFPVVDSHGNIIQAGKEEKVLIFRIACMFAVAMAGYTLSQLERERRLAATERARKADEKARAAAVRVQQIARDQRIEIRNEIHDGLAQSVRTLGLEVESIIDGPLVDGNAIRHELTGVIPMIQRVLEETYEYLHDAHPISSAEADLEDALARRVAESVRFLHLPASLTVIGQRTWVSHRVSRELTRILSEALMNAARHAHATRVEVELTFDRPIIVLQIRDNGVGFDIGAESNGIGLRSMQSRAARISGDLRIESSQREGTAVRVQVPIGERDVFRDTPSPRR